MFVEEVRARPPASEEMSSIADAMEEPEVVARRQGDEPVLGHGPVAATDNLTLLYSHRYLHETAAAQAERAAVQKLPFGLVMIGATGIDEINRRDGYAVGDQELRGIAGAVSRAADRTGGTAVATGVPASRWWCPTSGCPRPSAWRPSSLPSCPPRGGPRARPRWPGSPARRAPMSYGGPARPWPLPGLRRRLPSVRGACAALPCSS